MPEGAVYVGRPTLWGNPYTVRLAPSGVRWARGQYVVDAPDGKVLFPPDDRKAILGRTAALDHKKALAAAYAVSLYREALWIFEPEEDDFWTPLGGRDLACWCPLDLPCHADVLLEIANRPGSDA